ncbi:MAG: hypothetical protein R3C10_11795 [Pirellulales bacterium]
MTPKQAEHTNGDDQLVVRFAGGSDPRLGRTAARELASAGTCMAMQAHHSVDEAFAEEPGDDAHHAIVVAAGLCDEVEVA